ncbi:hypothetical protein BDW74DRAFT_174736 [Aspergillus multicolor]|uniref:uncharacterized protein n=1 Tax=Aspergillus multicolor TaxID=41759 RepID=UPI003CCCA54C
MEPNRGACFLCNTPSASPTAVLSDVADQAIANLNQQGLVTFDVTSSASNSATAPDAQKPPLQIQAPIIQLSVAGCQEQDNTALAGGYTRACSSPVCWTNQQFVLGLCVQRNFAYGRWNGAPFASLYHAWWSTYSPTTATGSSICGEDRRKLVYLEDLYYVGFVARRLRG